MSYERGTYCTAGPTYSQVTLYSNTKRRNPKPVSMDKHERAGGFVAVVVLVSVGVVAAGP